MWENQNIIVLDLEIEHHPQTVPGEWENRVGLGLAIGGFYDYAHGRIRWFNRQNLLETMRELIRRWPIIITFNGIRFDLTLMHDIAEAELDAGPELLWGFRQMRDSPRSWDILAEIWAADPASQRVKGLNGLDAIAAANGLPQKTGYGFDVPQWWAAGDHARVLNYCQQDIYILKQLAEKLSRTDGRIERTTSPVYIRYLHSDGGFLPPWEPTPAHASDGPDAPAAPADIHAAK